MYGLPVPNPMNINDAENMIIEGAERSTTPGRAERKSSMYPNVVTNIDMQMAL